MESALDHHSARALLEWHVELGATDAILDAPVNRYDLPAEMRKPAASGAAPTARPAETAARSDGSTQTARPNPAAPNIAAPDLAAIVAIASKAAQAAQDLPALAAAMAGFEHCDLRRGARSLVFGDGRPGAPVMILGEAPGRDEDREGLPFVGPAGQMLDRMLAAIGLDRHAEDRARAVYITNVLPWRPPQNRPPNPDEIAMMLPFIARHVELAAPRVLVLMGNIACQAALGQSGILRLRGTWAEAFGRPALPMAHPAYLLRSPEAKREAWADLLDLRDRIDALIGAEATGGADGAAANDAPAGAARP